MNSIPKIKIILASTRQGRQGEKIGKWVSDSLRGDSRAEWQLLDLRDYKLPYYDEAASPRMLAGKYTDPQILAWLEQIAAADGFIIITPEYNHGYPAVLKSALDFPYYEWNRKPVAFVSYGGPAGGARAVEQLRQVVIELQMAPIGEAIAIPFFRQAFEENGRPRETSYDQRLKTMTDQLLWWTEALRSARRNT